jgi:predicted amidohydrolase YtcJ
VDAEHHGAEGQTRPETSAGAKGISRKKFLAGTAAAGAAVGLGGAGAALGSGKAPATPKAGDREFDGLAFINGKIHTMDATNRVVSQIAIRNGVITGVGDAVPKGPNAKIYNLKGRTVIPGLIEGHVHVVSLANRPGYHVPGVENAKDIAGVQAALAARRPGVPEGQFITSMGGWHPNLFTERRLPTLQELDAAVSDRPVFLYQQGGGPARTNSLGKAFFESASDALAGPVVVGADGAIATGNPNMANRALYHLRTRQTFEDKVRGAADAMKYSAEVGLTAHLDQVLPPSNGPLVPTQGLPNLDQFRMYDGWLEAHRRELSVVRLQMNFLHNNPDPALTELRERLKNTFPLFGDDMMMTGAIGEWPAPGDGVGANAAVWQEANRLVAQAGWRCTNRNLSLAVLQAQLTAYEQLASEGFDLAGMRWTLHHLNACTQAELDRVKALGIGIQAGAWRFVTGTGTAAGSPFRLIVDSGVKAGIHQDGVHIATLNPWFAIYYASTGLNALGQQINVGQSITRQETVRLFTRENAWHLNMEDKIGSLEVGKLGDLLVLDRDYVTVSDEDLKRTKQLMTVVDGKVVYDAGVL